MIVLHKSLYIDSNNVIILRPEVSKREPVEDKLKLVILVHSSEIENNSPNSKTSTKISVYSNDRVITLKKIVEKKFGIACNNQIMVHEDRIMKGDLKFLNDFNLNQFDKIHIFDERDLEENIEEIEDGFYGVYQDFSTLSDNSLTLRSSSERGEDHVTAAKQKVITMPINKNKSKKGKFKYLL